MDKLLLGHTVRQEWVGGIDRSLSGQHQRCVSRLIGSDPTRILKGLGGECSNSVAPSTRFGQTGWHPPLPHGMRTNQLTQSDQPASRRLTGCGPHSPHHPSQPVMRCLRSGGGSFWGNRMPVLVRRRAGHLDLRVGDLRGARIGSVWVTVSPCARPDDVEYRWGVDRCTRRDRRVR